MAAPVGSEEALINSFEQISVDELSYVTNFSLPYKPEDDVAKGESEENTFCCCQVCKKKYEDDYQRDLWTPSIKLEDQFICVACQLEKWRNFKKFIQDAALKYGFDIVDDKTKTIIEQPSGLVFKMDHFAKEETLENNQVSLACTKENKEIMKLKEEINASTKADKRCTCHEGINTARENLQEKKNDFLEDLVIL